MNAAEKNIIKNEINGDKPDKRTEQPSHTAKSNSMLQAMVDSGGDTKRLSV